MLYLDASAITKLVVTEGESDELRAVVLGRRLATSRVSVVEVGKAVGRARPDADASTVLAMHAFVEFDAELAAVAAAAGGATLRALVAIHVASALRLGPEVEWFLTYDDRQADAAAAAGLRVLAPGRRDEPEVSRG